jgi:hypothetical protein
VTDPSFEPAQPPTGPGVSDAVTLSFADPAAGRYDVLRPG